MENPADRKYTKEHEWIKIDGDIATVGITDYAQHALTDIVFVELPEVGKQVEKDKQLCVLESVKSVTDVFAPLSGEVVEANSKLEAQPEKLNNSPFNAWIAKIKIKDKSEVEQLIEAKEYTEYVDSLEH